MTVMITLNKSVRRIVLSMEISSDLSLLYFAVGVLLPTMEIEFTAVKLRVLNPSMLKANARRRIFWSILFGKIAVKDEMFRMKN